jgi:hypothetical protein
MKKPSSGHSPKPRLGQARARTWVQPSPTPRDTFEKIVKLGGGKGGARLFPTLVPSPGQASEENHENPGSALHGGRRVRLLAEDTGFESPPRCNNVYLKK